MISRAKLKRWFWEYLETVLIYIALETDYRPRHTKEAEK